MRAVLDPSPALSIEITRARVYTVGKWWVRRIALKIWTRRDKARCGRCFKALFGYRSGPEICWPWDPWWLPEPPYGRLNWVRWQRSGSKTSAPRQPSQQLPGPWDRSPAETDFPDCRQGLRLSLSLRERFPPGWPGETE